MKEISSAFIPLSQDLLFQGRSLRFTAKGCSMYPAIRDGDSVEIAPYNQGVDVLRSGDIIFYRVQPAAGILHRIVKIKRRHNEMLYITKGDAQAFDFTAVRPSEILGRLTAAERKGKRYSAGSIYMRSLAFFALRLYPVLLLLRRFLAWLLERIQGLRFYCWFVRKISPTDIQYMSEAMDSLSRRFWAQADSKVIAEATLYYFEPGAEQPCGWWLFGLLVGWRYRRLGVGKNLVSRASGYIKEKGAEVLSAFVFEDNIRAIDFYQSLGFSKQEASPRQDETNLFGREKIVMSKRF